MASVTALIVVLALAGSPAATLVCIGLCPDLPSTTSSTCHHDGARHDPTPAVTSPHTCAELVAAIPFLTEHGRATSTNPAPVRTGHAPYAWERPSQGRFASTKDGNDASPPAAVAVVLRA